MTFSRTEGKKQFAFKETNSENTVNRSKNDSDRDSFINLPGVKWFKVKDNNKDEGHCYRNLPPFWDNAEHWGIDIWVHYNIGEDNNAYLCLNKMKKGNCPICEEMNKITDEKVANAIRPVHRVLQWLIDRDNEKDSPMLWAAPEQFDTTICSVAVNRRSGAARKVSNPDTGCDISFKIDGVGKHRKYLAHKCEDPSTLSDDVDKYNEWLEFAQKHPIPNLLKFYNYDHIYNVYHGKSPVQEEKVATTENSSIKSVEPCSEPKPHKFDYTNEQIMAASTEELDKVLDNIIQHISIDESAVSNMDDAKLKVYICQLLKLSPVVEEESPATKLRNRFKRNSSPV